MADDTTPNSAALELPTVLESNFITPPMTDIEDDNLARNNSLFTLQKHNDTETWGKLHLLTHYCLNLIFLNAPLQILIYT